MAGRQSQRSRASSPTSPAAMPARASSDIPGERLRLRPYLSSCPAPRDKITRRAKFRFRRRANHLYDSRHPVPEEGALAIVTERWDGMRWTRRHRARDGIAGGDNLREHTRDVLAR